MTLLATSSSSTLYSLIEMESIFPSSEELLTPNYHVVIEANKIKGPYDNERHYLAVQYNLLREDYFRSIKQGIKSAIEQVEAGKNILQDRDGKVRVYDNVRIVSENEHSYAGVFYTLQFDKDEIVEWSTSERLRQGALLCFFVRRDYNLSLEVIFATVARKNIEHLKKGYLDVAIEFDDERHLKRNIFFMVEVIELFDAYKHVLIGFKDLYHSYDYSEQSKNNIIAEYSNTRLPFVNAIVKGDCSIKQIQALIDAPDMRYNFRSLLRSTEEDESKYSSLNKLTYCLSHYDTWPSPAEFELDESQRKAYI